jgi:hypothetical protein
MSDEKTIGEMMKWKNAYKQEKQKNAELQQKNTALEQKLVTIQESYQELEGGINDYLDEQEANPTAYESQIRELENKLVRTQLESKFEKLAGSQLHDGINFDTVLRNLPDFDVSQLDPNALDDEFFASFVSSAQERAGFLFRPASQPQTDAQPAMDQASQNTPAAKRVMPTFTQRSSGGGAPTPIESQMTIARLRDPVDAMRRAAEARAEAAREAV